MITFDNVSKVFPNGYVGLDEVSFEIDAGTLTFVEGESGAGKTTLMRLMIREFMPTEGEIWIDGESITRLPLRKVPYLRRKVAVVFQDFKLIPERTVAENIDLVLEISGMPSRQRPQRIHEVLSLIELADRAALFPVQLSGGELQRVAFARALATTPSVIFADEPTGNLDPKTSADIGELIQKIVEMGTTVVVATHDQELMKRQKSRVLTLNQGKIVHDTQRKKKLAQKEAAAVSEASESSNPESSNPDASQSDQPDQSETAESLPETDQT